MSLVRLSQICLALGMMCFLGLFGQSFILLDRLNKEQDQLAFLLQIQREVGAISVGADAIAISGADQELYDAFVLMARRTQADLQSLENDFPDARNAVRAIDMILTDLDPFISQNRADYLDRLTGPNSADDFANLVESNIASHGIALDAALNETLRQRQKQIAAQDFWVAASFASVASLFLFVAVSSFGLIYQRIGGPLRAFARTIKAVDQGHPGARAPDTAHDEIGEVGRAFNALIDRRRAAEEELERTSSILRIAGQMARLGGWRYDAKKRELEWSDETALIYGELPGTQPSLDDWLTYYVEKDRPRIEKLFGACVEKGEPFDDIFRIRNAKGSLVWLRSAGQPLSGDDGTIIGAQGAFQDVSDLVEARSEAEQRDAELQDVISSIGDGFMVLDRELNFRYANTTALRLMGRAGKNVVGLNIWKEFPQALGTDFDRNYNSVLETGQSQSFVGFFAELEKWFAVSAHATREGLAVYFRDYTDEYERQSQLRLLQTATDRINDIILITEADPLDAPNHPRIVYANAAFERRTGYTREEALATTPRLLQGPETDRSQLDRIRAALAEWKPVRAELINYTKSGNPFWLELEISPVADETGKYTHWIAVERDITERKQTEDALRANEERFRLVAKAAGNAIWDLDIDGNREWWSEGLRDIFGYERDPEATTPHSWRAHVHPEDLPGADAAFERLISGQTSVLHDQYRFQRADGSWAIVQDNAFALYDDTGKVIRVLGSMTDISEQKLLEERLRQAQKMEAVGQLTGGVAHDFNNLLTIILGNAEILEEELTDLPHLQRLAKMSLDAAVRGADLTSRLLSFSRKQALNPKVLDVASLIQGMDGLLRRTLPENINMEIIRSGGLWKIEADASQLEAALLNLVLNSRDAMPGGGSLTIEMGNATLNDEYVAAESDVKPGRYVVIVVTDTGAGISQDKLARVFEPFFTTKEVGKGSGLGLSMVFGFVKQSGGHVQVYSELGEGTAIKMYFPRSLETQETTSVDHTGQSEASGGMETILVVEDDGAVRKYVTVQLQRLGYHVLEAATGAEAVEILRKTPDIDLLFTDVVMPGGMGGRDLADAARKHRPDLKVLFTSGYTENSIVHHGRLDPGVKLLNKPYRREQLAAKVREILDA